MDIYARVSENEGENSGCSSPSVYFFCVFIPSPPPLFSLLRPSLPPPLSPILPPPLPPIPPLLPRLLSFEKRLLDKERNGEKKMFESGAKRKEVCVCLLLI